MVLTFALQLASSGYLKFNKFISIIVSLMLKTIILGNITDIHFLSSDNEIVKSIIIFNVDYECN
jgi:hypothetical protein